MSEPDAAAEPPESSPDAPVTQNLETRLVRELADVLNDTGLTEIEVERGDLRIRVAKSLTIAAPPLAAPAHLSPIAAPTSDAAAVTGPPKPAAVGRTVKSPMVGTVYLQPQPGAAPFVGVGDRVNEGQTLLLVEAMKTMNPIVAPTGGVLLELLVADGQPVEYGEPLAVIG